MKPYYKHKGITIFNGDCREVLKDLNTIVYPYQTVVTDPVWPNSLPELVGSGRPKELLGEALDIILWNGCAERLAINLGADSDPRFLSVVPEWFKFHAAIWLEYAVPHFKGRVMAGSEIAYLFGKPPSSRKGRHTIGGRVMDNTAVGKWADHPAPRSLHLTKQLIARWADDDDVILDPFMGSGTTLVAAKHLGFQAIGIEIEEKYCASAVSRLSQEVLV